MQKFEKRSVIGKGMKLKGNISSEEEILIEGVVEGTIKMNHNVIVGKSGKVKADITAKEIVIEGEVNGNVTGKVKVEIVPGGVLNGDIISEKVVLADGAKFKGSIDMTIKKEETGKKENYSKPSDKTGTSAALDELAERINRRGLVVIMSDFLDDDISVTNALKHFRHRNHEVVVFHILDPQEIEFKFGTSANFVDAESGEEMVTQPYQIRKSYKAAVNSFIHNIQKECYNHNIDYNLITTSDTFDKALRKFLSKRARI